MASIKIKFKPSTLKDHEGSVYYQVIKDRKVKQFFTGYHIFSREWDEKRCAVKLIADSQRANLLQSVRDNIRWDLEQITAIIRKFEGMGTPFSCEDIVEDFIQQRRECSLFNFMERVIANLRANGKFRTSETYRAALSSFRKFRNDVDVFMHEMSSGMMGEYEGWLCSGGISANTVSFYMRILRATYNRAVEDGKIEDRRPFRHVYTGVDKTVKRALPISTIRKIKNLALEKTPALDYARDIFLLSFCLRGMSFIDMAFLKKSNLTNGYVTYRRRKTGQLLIIKWTKEMQTILDKYSENDSVYLLPILRKVRIEERDPSARRMYRNAGSNIGRSLKKIGNMLRLDIPLTLYVARHSWASAARAKGVPVNIISEGMGHNSEKTTLIYLASLDASAVDRANSMILSDL